MGELVVNMFTSLDGVLQGPGSPDEDREGGFAYGVSRQTLLQRVKRGELRAVHVRTGRRKGLRIEPPTPQDGLF